MFKWFWTIFSLGAPDILNILAPVVQKLDNAIHRMNRYPANKYYESQYALSFG